jgi:hypothetical protein
MWPFVKRGEDSQEEVESPSCSGPDNVWRHPFVEASDPFFPADRGEGVSQIRVLRPFRKLSVVNFKMLDIQLQYYAFRKKLVAKLRFEYIFYAILTARLLAYWTIDKGWF